ncbi:MAG: acyl transferase [Bacteroidota bacterium]
MKANAVFKIISPSEFKHTALRMFRFQYQNNSIYSDFCNHLNRHPANVKTLSDIPYLPIQCFKTHRVLTGTEPVKEIFTSSGTTGNTSKHYLTDTSLYRKSYRSTFQYFYGAVKEYTILALLPAYLERKGSSLVYMVHDLIEQTGTPESGFYLRNLKELKEKLIALDAMGKPILLIGVSFALLALAERYTFRLKNTIIMETGGMKGRRKEMTRTQLHHILCNRFGVTKIHSEYGMTELLSQAYSMGNGIFKPPPWMKIMTRETEDPLTLQAFGKTGGINIIDLANRNSCAFIATQDLGRSYADGSFEVLGRFDHADIRGCNLMLL